MAIDPRSSQSAVPAAPPDAWPQFVRLASLARRPLEHFLRIEAASGIVLLIAAAVALVWANSPWAESYEALWHTQLGVSVGALRFQRPLAWFVNDALMVIFFFVVGLEIRRELHQGELSEWRRAALPATAALGGMVAPACLYLSLASAPSIHAGWGVPMATDIAFAVGILTLLGERVPPALRVLLLALAVIDDLGAIAVIAAFYSDGIAWSGLLVAALALVAILALQRFGVRAKVAYMFPGFMLWAGVYRSGVHPTIAGVIIGMLTPVRAWFGTEGFLAHVRSELTPLRAAEPDTISAHDVASRLREVDLARREALSPAEGLIESLHPWVAFVIMPVFALANAGVSLRGVTFDAASLLVASGTAVGLVAGKPLGVLIAVGLSLKLGLGRLPTGLEFRHLLVLGAVAGVGFTMALFVAQLAFADPTLLAAAKLGVLVASGVAALLTLLLGRTLLSRERVPGCAASADEAEQSTSA